MEEDDAPRHTTDLEIPQMRAILLLSPTWELASQELDGGHGGDEGVDMVLCEVPTTNTR